MWASVIPLLVRASTYLTDETRWEIEGLEIGQVLHLKSEIRNGKSDCPHVRGPIQYFGISDLRCRTRPISKCFHTLCQSSMLTPSGRRGVSRPNNFGCGEAPLSLFCSVPVNSETLTDWDTHGNQSSF